PWESPDTVRSGEGGRFFGFSLSWWAIGMIVPPEYLTQDETADHVIELATYLGLTLLSPLGQVTYPNAYTTIDLVWGTKGVEDKLVKCQIATKRDFGSDHLPIETIL